MTIIEHHGRYGVVDNGKAGGIHTSVEVLANGTIRTIGTHTSFELASKAAEGLDALDQEVPSRADLNKRDVWSFSILGYRLTVSKG